MVQVHHMLLCTSANVHDKYNKFDWTKTTNNKVSQKSVACDCSTQPKPNQAKLCWDGNIFSADQGAGSRSQTMNMQLTGPLRPISAKQAWSARLVDYIYWKNNMVAILDFCTKVKNSYFLPLNHHLYQI